MSAIEKDNSERGGSVICREKMTGKGGNGASASADQYASVKSESRKKKSKLGFLTKEVKNQKYY